MFESASVDTQHSDDDTLHGPAGPCVTPYASMMRSVVAMTAVLLTVALCACSTPATTAKTAQPYTCIAPSRPPAPATPATMQHTIAVIGDSYTSGSPQGGTGDKRWTTVVAAGLRSHGVDAVMKVGAEGGAGYVHPGRNTNEVFADKVAATVKPNDGLVVFFGSRNDSRATPGQMARASCDTLRSAEMTAPTAKLLVIGPAWVNANPPHYILQDRDILRQRVDELGGQFIDPIADRWFMDQPDLIGADGVHPTDAGHQYMAQKIEPVIEQQLTGQGAH